MSRQLEGKVAIITGAARGLGKATALLFAKEGAAVVVADVDEAGGEAVVGEIQAAGGNAHFVRTDVSDAAQARAMAAVAAQKFGAIHILVNNAGITRDATLRKMDEAAFDAVIAINLKGVYNGTQAVVPYLIEAGWGRILSAASVVAHNGNFGQTNYVAAKAGVIGMTKTWARELGRYQITANAVAPGFIETDMIGTVPEKVLSSFRERTPLGRLGKPEEIAQAYLFLASDAASFITGAVLNVDGGLVV